MNLTNIILWCAILYGVFLLIGLFAHKERPRTEYLEKLKRLLDGELGTIESSPNSYRLFFTYQKKKFVYEDIEELGFRHIKYKGILKVEANSDLNLEFLEKDRSKLLGNITQSKDSDDKKQEVEVVKPPKALADFYIHSNSPQRVEALFSDDDILKIFAGFKNFAVRGRPLMSLEIKSGVVVLEFHSERSLRPHIYELKEDYSRIEKYIYKLLIVAKALDEIGYAKKGDE